MQGRAWIPPHKITVDELITVREHTNRAPRAARGDSSVADGIASAHALIGGGLRAAVVAVGADVNARFEGPPGDSVALGRQLRRRRRA